MSSIVTTTSSFHAPENLPQLESPTTQGGPQTHLVASTSIFGSQNFNPDAMTPDALLLYLSTRLGSIDGQMQEVLNRQKHSEKVRSEIGEIQKVLATITTNDDDENAEFSLSEADANAIDAHIRNIENEDPELAAELCETLHKDGQILCETGKYTTAQVNGTKDYLNLTSKNIESSAQMDMINLQSMMGARQTAIQLSTNLVSALSESAKAVVANIR